MDSRVTVVVSEIEVANAHYYKCIDNNDAVLSIHQCVCVSRWSQRADRASVFHSKSSISGALVAIHENGSN